MSRSLQSTSAKDKSIAHHSELIDQISALLRNATSVEQITDARQAAEAARSFAKAARLGLDIQNRAAELKLRAERKAGEFLAGLKLQGGDRRSKSYTDTLKLIDLGITKQQSQRWQLVSGVPEADFERYLQSQQQLGAEITASDVYRIARRTCMRSVKASAHSPNGCCTYEIIKEVSIDGQARFGELHSELTHHCDLLNRLLEPVYEGNGKPLRTVERQHIARLVVAMKQIIEQLASFDDPPLSQRRKKL